MLGVIPYGTSEEIPRRRFPYVTVALVILNIVIFVWELKLSGSGSLEAFIAQFGTIPVEVTGRHFIDPSLLTFIFLHGGLLHIAGNMLFLLAFGDNVEDRLGHLRYLFFYLLWGVIGSATHVLFNLGSNVPSIGASGAIAGVLGAYLVLFPRGQVRVFLFIFVFFTLARLPAVFMIVGWFALQLLNGVASLGATTTETGGVAVWAHVGGFVAGLLTALALRPTLPPQSDPSPIGRLWPRRSPGRS